MKIKTRVVSSLFTCLLVILSVFALGGDIRANGPTDGSLAIPMSAGSSVTVYEQTTLVSMHTYSVATLMTTGDSFTTTAAEYYTVTSDGTNLTIHCYRNIFSSDWSSVGNNIVAVRLDGVPGYPGGVWASMVVGYTLGYNGAAESRFNALGADTLIGPYENLIATYMGDQHSELVLGFSVVAKATAVVTLGNLSQTYDGTPKSATATTVPPGLSVTLTYDGTATAPTNAGSYGVLATVNDPSYQGSASGTLVIAKADQTITFGVVANKTYGDADFTVSATASSGLAVSFTASGACTISGNTVHITGLGSCTITAHQSGNGNYDAAPDVSQTFTVNMTYNRLEDLVRQFVTKQGTANSLLAKLDNAQKAEARGDVNAKTGMIGAFVNAVEAQTGKTVSAEHAEILIALAKAL